MSVYLVDTDTLTLAQHQHPLVCQRILRHIPQDTVAVSVISIQEQMDGWRALLGRARTRQDLAAYYLNLQTRLLPSWGFFPVLPFSEPAILRFEQLVTLRLNVGRMDLRIAAIALGNPAVVVTRNQRDFGRVPGLHTEDWSA